MPNCQQSDDKNAYRCIGLRSLLHKATKPASWADEAGFVFQGIRMHLLMFLAYPREAVPNGFQRTAFEVSEPPMRECQLEQEEGDANQEAQRGAAIEVHLQPVSVINETSDNGLGDIVGQAHLAVRHQYLLHFPFIDPIENEERADHYEHESQVVP